MNIYEELGLRPIINANATLTRLGGSVMHPDVVAAMVEAAKHFVDLDDLQRTVGQRLAELTQNEAAYVSSGAAAGLTLAAAACMTGTNPAAIAQLPDTTGLQKTKIIVHKSHRNGYDHAVRQTGAELVEIGYAGSTQAWELEAAINEKTAAVFWFQGVMTGNGDLPLEQVIEIANASDVPVIVDGAAQVPPTENLWQWTQMGAALAVFSGGKDLHGPQSSGLVVGRQDLIEAMRLNGSPNHSIGRPMKVGKEEMMGLLKAVELYLTINQEDRLSRDEETVAGWCQELNKVAGVSAQRSFPNEAGQPLPRALVTIDPAVANVTRDGVVQQLLEGSPAISVATADSDGIFVNPMTLYENEDEIVLKRLLDILNG